MVYATHLLFPSLVFPVAPSQWQCPTEQQPGLCPVVSNNNVQRWFTGVFNSCILHDVTAVFLSIPLLEARDKLLFLTSLLFSRFSTFLFSGTSFFLHKHVMD